jgi:hypothetical protein
MTPLTAHRTPEHVASRGHRVGIARRCHLGSHRGRARRCCRRPAGSWLPRDAPGLLGDPGGRVRPHQLCASGNRPGAAWVKVIADFPDLAAGTDAEATYQIGAIADLVAAVHAAGVRVAVHSTIAGVGQLVAAGVDSIEHGYGLDEGASTWPRRFLGAAAGADIVTYHHDPREDADQLAGPAAVVAGGIRLR